VIVDALERQFQYNDWANREVCHRFKEIGEPPRRAVQLLAHILAAEWLWMVRLGYSQVTMPVWPELRLGRCEQEMEDLKAGWRRFFEALTDRELYNQVHYVNTQGQEHDSSLVDILQHVILHGVYHRGQIAAELRAAGHEPPYTDFIHATRKGLVK
jgi:uncharacterized damage-inducible protein DinB